MSKRDNWEWSDVPGEDIGVGLSYPCLGAYTQGKSVQSCKKKGKHGHIVLITDNGKMFVPFACATHAGLRRLLRSLSRNAPELFTDGVVEEVLSLMDAWRLPSGEVAATERLQFRDYKFLDLLKDIIGGKRAKPPAPPIPKPRGNGTA